MSGENNTSFDAVAGTDAGKLVTGNEATAIGSHALEKNINGETTAVGAYASANNQHGLKNTSVGAWALRYNTGGGNTAIGHRAIAVAPTETGLNDSGAYGNGDNNTAVGSEALRDNTSGSNNTAVGEISLNNNTTGSNNTSIGASSGSVSTEAENCTFIGHGAKSVSTTATESFRSAVGAGAEVEADNSMVLGKVGDLGTNVGIGTTKPEHRLHVNGNSLISGAQYINVKYYGDGAVTYNAVDDDYMIVVRHLHDVKLPLTPPITTSVPKPMEGRVIIIQNINAIAVDDVAVFLNNNNATINGVFYDTSISPVPTIPLPSGSYLQLVMMDALWVGAYISP